MKKNTLLSIALAAAFISTAAASDEIKSVMKKYHKPEDALCKKVGAGTATDSELGDLLKAYKDIAKESPPKGDAASWDKKTKALIDAVTAVKAKDEKGVSAFKEAVNCKACHSVHK